MNGGSGDQSAEPIVKTCHSENERDESDHERAVEDDESDRCRDLGILALDGRFHSRDGGGPTYREACSDEDRLGTAHPEPPTHEDGAGQAAEDRDDHGEDNTPAERHNIVEDDGEAQKDDADAEDPLRRNRRAGLEDGRELHRVRKNDAGDDREKEGTHFGDHPVDKDTHDTDSKGGCQARKDPLHVFTLSLATSAPMR